MSTLQHPDLKITAKPGDIPQSYTVRAVPRHAHEGDAAAREYLRKLADEFEKRGFEAHVGAVSDTENPKRERLVSELEITPQRETGKRASFPSPDEMLELVRVIHENLFPAGVDMPGDSNVTARVTPASKSPRR